MVIQREILLHLIDRLQTSAAWLVVGATLIPAVESAQRESARMLIWAAEAEHFPQSVGIN